MGDPRDTLPQIRSTSKAPGILVEELKGTLQSPQILTPDSEGYSDSIKRWSDGVEKRAVRAICDD